VVATLEDIARSELLLAKIEAKQEIKQKIAGLEKATRSLRAGFLAAVYAVGFLLLAGMYGLSMVLPPWAAALSIGVVLAIVAFALIGSGKAKLKDYVQSSGSVQEGGTWVTTPEKSNGTSMNGAAASTRTSTN
jgi:hypothetical protein